jgi:pyruvate,orthophosphate dikinase
MPTMSPSNRRPSSASRKKPARSPTSKARKRKQVYSFGDGKADGHRGLRELLGGKGANLAEMCRLGLPVPPGFTVSTEVCSQFNRGGRRLPSQVRKDVLSAMARVERSLGRRFGDGKNPLLVSVRSGARVSMPGMMDTVLNLGLNDSTALGLAQASGNERFALDAYRRFVQMYGDVVLGIKGSSEHGQDPFRERFEELKQKRKIALDTDVPVADLRSLVRDYKQLVKQHTGKDFPEDPYDQLWGAIAAVFSSWNNERAVAYRALNDIPGDWGTAVNVMAMVFGNLGEDSGTGVAFTRDPSSGEKRFYGEYLMNAQGEDVVAGLRTPEPIATLKQRSPAMYRQLEQIQKKLEHHYGDMQDLEFTIERGRLFMLQTRAGKRTGFAAVRIAVDLVRERLISKEEALLRVEPDSLEQLLKGVFDARELTAARASGRVISTGLNAGPGAATGQIAFTAAEADERARKGQSVILVRLETSPEDIRGMQASAGILTARGGMTSHAALVGRQMGKVCVVGAGDCQIDSAKKRLVAAGRKLRAGDWLSLDGTTGEVIEGRVATQPSEVMAMLVGPAGSRRKPKGGPTWAAFQKLMKWADDVRRLDVRANADQPDQCRMARALGAVGVGLCRTEHMFFEGHKIDCVREMILAENAEERARALAKLLPLQRADFEGIFTAMAPYPVTIRSLDPPLHEFLPHEDKEIRGLARDMGVPFARLKAKALSLHELNPMLGHRGCRLGISFPEITEMQARAIFEAACRVKKKTKKTVLPEIMIPLIGTARELVLQAAVIRRTAEAVMDSLGVRVPYLVGTMIELPRAALMAAEIAAEAEFFSFGTNDLTQTTFGISRDDAGFIPEYVKKEIFERDPFTSLDIPGVGRLMQIAVAEGRKTRPEIKLGICGEHGGDPRSVEFCDGLGLDYVSCSPLRVPTARLAAAQARLR